VCVNSQVHLNIEFNTHQPKVTQKKKMWSTTSTEQTSAPTLTGTMTRISDGSAKGDALTQSIVAHLDKIVRSVDGEQSTLDTLPLDLFNSRGQPQCVLSGSALLKAICASSGRAHRDAPWTAGDIDLFATESVASHVRRTLEKSCGLSYRHCVPAGSKYEMNDANIHHVEVWTVPVLGDAVRELSDADKARMGIQGSCEIFCHERADGDIQVKHATAWRNSFEGLTLQLIVVAGEDASAVVDTFDVDIVKNTIHRDALSPGASDYVVRAANLPAIQACRATLTPREEELLMTWCHNDDIDDDSHGDMLQVYAALHEHWPQFTDDAPPTEADAWKMATKALARFVKYAQRGFTFTNERAGEWLAFHFRKPPK
jgi:hypothetical protein